MVLSPLKMDVYHFSDISLFRHNFCRKSETLFVTLFRHLVFQTSHFSDSFSNFTRIIYIHINPELLENQLYEH